MSKAYKNLRIDVASTILHREVIAFPEGGCEWTIHQKDPTRPRATFFISLRTADNKGVKQGKLRYTDVVLIAQLFVEMIQSRGIVFDRICGIPNAGEPFAKEVVRLFNLDLSYLIELEKVGEGADKFFKIKGDNYNPGDVILLLDDLINHNGTKQLAISALTDAGLVVNDIVVLMDGQFGGSEELRLQGIDLHAAWNTRDLFGFAKVMGLLPDFLCDATQDFVASERLELTIASQTHARVQNLREFITKL